MASQGISGTIKWKLDDEGTLFFEPINGKEGTFAESTCSYHGNWQGYEWNQFGKDIKQIKSTSKINLAKDSSYMFYNCSALTNLDGLKNWNTSDVTDMSGMFYDCSSLTNCEGLKNWNTYNIECSYFMFFGCTSLAKIGVSNTNKNILYFLPDNETNTLSYKYHKVGTTNYYCTPYDFNYNWDSSFEGIWSREKEQNNVVQNSKKELEIENINLSIDKKNLTVTVPIGTTVTIQFK